MSGVRAKPSEIAAQQKNIASALLIPKHEYGECVELLAERNASDYLQKTPYLSQTA